MTFNAGSITLLLKALTFAAHRHSDQRRKDESASPYINHPIAVAQTLWEIGEVRDMSTIVSGILHDTIEDTDTTPEELEAEFGSEIRSIVEEVTDDKSLPQDVRKRLQVEHAGSLSVRAGQIKLADKICNISDVLNSPPADWSPEEKLKYAAWGEEVVKKLRGTNEHLEKYFDELYIKAKQKFSEENLP